MSTLTPDPLARTRADIAGAVARLTAGHARDEALGEFRPASRWLVFPRRARMVRLGRVWRLGVLLLGSDGRLRQTGDVIRALPPKWPNHQSALADRRHEYQSAAHRGRFAKGETVNFGAPELALDLETLRQGSGPLFLVGDTVLVRWAAGSGAATAVPLGPYLAERVELLLAPAAG